MSISIHQNTLTREYKGMFHLFTRILLLFLLLLSITNAENNKINIYSDVEKSVYQIRVLNKQTRKKSVIGSGFVVGRADILATNYHVVSSYVNEPETYDLEYFSTSGETGALELLDLDVVHDLAVVKAKKALGKPLNITNIPNKGANLYSLGNPMDLGFSIVEGTNNGLMKYSEEKNILFSGSLNPGMSGGPTLNESGEVVGVNVATSGNEISFLVPAEHLSSILGRLKLRNYKPEDDFFQLISDQLLSDNKAFISRLLSEKWGHEKIGKFSVPSELSRSVRCWDISRVAEEDDLFRLFFTRCSNERGIYLDDGLELGTLDYEYQWLESDELHPARLYNHYEEMNDSSLPSNAGKDDVTNFACNTRFISVDKQDFKATICRRDYINYTGLSDVLITMAMVGHKNKGFIFNLDMVGTDFDSALKLYQKILGEFKWKG